MADIYLGGASGRGRGRWKTVFIVIVLLQLVVLGGYLYFSKKADVKEDVQPETALAGTPALAEIAPAIPLEPASSPQATAVVSDARSATEAGQLADARIALERLLDTTPDAEALKLLGNVNVQLLKSPRMMPGKEYYVVQSGDSLSKIAKKFNTTVTLIKTMNGMETDVIRLGARLLVFNSDFTIRVSKTRNTLDLISNGKTFKRYSVGTGKFGKTPEVTFTIYDKIVEPPWTRPRDNKQIEYGDPENVLGTRWMALKSADHPEITGYGIHGTWERDSIGKQSSAGCVRMLNEDVEELFDLVPRKTTVIITD